jgi:hypothetical protein
MDVSAKVARLKRLITSHYKQILLLQSKCPHRFELIDSREVYYGMDYHPTIIKEYKCSLCEFCKTEGI